VVDQQQGGLIMGGQNHQPTNRPLIASSAWLSQKFGEGFVAVLEANNQLENAIIIAEQLLHVEDLAKGLDGTAVDHLDRTIASLTVSLEKIGEIEVAYDNLFAASAREGYTGNPLASSIRRFNLRESLSGDMICPNINQQVWQEVEQRINDQNVLDTLRWEQSRFRELNEPTRQLIAVLEDCKKVAGEEGGDAFVDAVEYNRLPLRQHYARVLSLWNYLHAMFLYSALMTTELFYRVNELPSLAEQKTASSRRAVANEPAET